MNVLLYYRLLSNCGCFSFNSLMMFDTLCFSFFKLCYFIDCILCCLIFQYTDCLFFLGRSRQSPQQQHCSNNSDSIGVDDQRCLHLLWMRLPAPSSILRALSLRLRESMSHWLEAELFKMGSERLTVEMHRLIVKIWEQEELSEEWKLGMPPTRLSFKSSLSHWKISTKINIKIYTYLKYIESEDARYLDLLCLISNDHNSINELSRAPISLKSCLGHYNSILLMVQHINNCNLHCVSYNFNQKINNKAN